MTYRAVVFNVMIASPFDVAAERSLVREMVHEWNAVHSFTRGLVLQPIGWETHSSPSMGGHPQHIVNEQTLAKADLLVGVFWTRLGTKTPEYVSGTVEEIERHIAAGKPAMLYFSKSPVHLDSVDDSQYRALKEFKSSCQSRGLYMSYDGLTDFRDQFYRHLQLKINEDSFFAISDGPAAEEHALMESEAAVAALSKQASLLLKEAASDRSGTVMLLRHLGGTDLQTNGKNLIPDRDRRSVATWEAALQELVDAELLVERGYKGELFEVTKKGYEFAEYLAV
jgi:hypothetical protein